MMGLSPMPNDVLTRAIDAVCSGEHLTADHTSAVLEEIMGGRASEVQTGAFLVALRAKGETVAELVGLARTMRSLCARVETGRDDLVDTAGTGGGPTTYNVSTVAALIAAGAGCAVAKHGNRSATSKSGSADVLEALGVKIDLESAQVARCIEEVGFGFMFAPLHHSATKHVVPVRKELAVRTIFNFLGPLTNPAGARRQLVGVSDRHHQETVAEALAVLGCERALVVTAADGTDELSLWAENRVIEVRDGGTEEWFATPADAGLSEAPLESVAGGDPERNAITIRAVLGGGPGPARDIAVLNAAAAILVAGKAEDLAEGAEQARQAIDSGQAQRVLERLATLTTTLSPSN
jgi:anthranilate phosphoribosyltransferase